MTNAIAWLLFFLGLVHIGFGLVKFKEPLSEAIAAGFIGKFKETEIRRTAFWFVIFGPLLMLAGHAAIHAVSIGDLEFLKIIGAYALLISVVGVAAFPKSPFLVTLVASTLLIAAGYGWLI